MEPTRILKCSCTHDYEDNRYGKGRRVHNALQRLPDKMQYRCTVCGIVRTDFTKSLK